MKKKVKEITSTEARDRFGYTLDSVYYDEETIKIFRRDAIVAVMVPHDEWKELIKTQKKYKKELKCQQKEKEAIEKDLKTVFDNFSWLRLW